MADTAVDVVVQIGDEDVLAGRLWAHRRRATESATFSYATEYLARRDAYELDPVLPLSPDAQQTPVGRPIFGAFSDCAPDRHRPARTARRRQQAAEAARRRPENSPATCHAYEARKQMAKRYALSKVRAHRAVGVLAQAPRPLQVDTRLWLLTVLRHCVS